MTAGQRNVCASSLTSRAVSLASCKTGEDMLRRFALALLAAAMPAWVAADVLDKIAERGTIRLGIRTSAPPFAYLDADGQPRGLAVRLCVEAAKRIGQQLGQDLKTEFVPVDAKSRFPALIAGETDLHCGPASATLSRRELLDFSILYFVDGAAPATRPGALDAVFETARGRFGALANTTTVDVVRDLVERNGIKGTIETYSQHKDGLAALAAGKIDVYVADRAILLFQIERLNLAEKLEVGEEVFSFEPYALVMKRGESRLRLAVDRALSRIYADAVIYRFIREELGDYEIPPEVGAVYNIAGMPE